MCDSSRVMPSVGETRLSFPCQGQWSDALENKILGILRRYRCGVGLGMSMGVRNVRMKIEGYPNKQFIDEKVVYRQDRH